METATNRIKITFFDNSTKWINATSKKIIKENNVVNFISKKIGLNNVKKIESRKTGAYDKTYKYFELHYDYKFEQWKNQRARIEAKNPKGHEDYTGYGNSTDGLKNRFYIGKSTGFMPIYLEILKSNSFGGGSLYLANGKRQFSRVN